MPTNTVAAQYNTGFIFIHDLHVEASSVLFISHIHSDVAFSSLKTVTSVHFDALIKSLGCCFSEHYSSEEPVTQNISFHLVSALDCLSVCPCPPDVELDSTQRGEAVAAHGAPTPGLSAVF